MSIFCGLQLHHPLEEPPEQHLRGSDLDSIYLPAAPRGCRVELAPKNCEILAKPERHCQIPEYSGLPYQPIEQHVLFVGAKEPFLVVSIFSRTKHPWGAAFDVLNSSKTRISISTFWGHLRPKPNPSNQLCRNVRKVIKTRKAMVTGSIFRSFPVINAENQRVWRRGRVVCHLHAG